MPLSYGVAYQPKALSAPNAVAEALHCIIKIDFTFNRELAIFERLELLWFNSVN